MKRLILLIVVMVIAFWIFLTIKRSIPYGNRKELLSSEISIDSIWSLGPAAGIYDKSSEKYYWLKFYTALDKPKLFDTLRSKRAKIRYMKFLMGPLENRIYWMEIDSIVVFDQVVESDTVTVK